MPQGLRKLLFWAHLVIGIAIALPVFVLCISGILMTYERQTETWIDFRNIESHPPAPGARVLPVEALIRKVHESRGVDPESVKVSSDETRPVEVQLDGKPPTLLYVDRYSGAVLGGPSQRTRRVFQTIRAWHLALRVSGKHHESFRAIVNGSNLMAFVLAILGILLWIPKRWTWRHLRVVLLFRSGVAGRARDFNWHNVIGIWSAAALLIIVWTGIALSYKPAFQWTDRFINAADAKWLEWRGTDGAVVERGPVHAEEEPAAGPAASLEELLERAKSQARDWKAITLFVPRPDSRIVYFAIDMNGDGIRAVSSLGLDRAGKVANFVPAGSGGLSSPTFVRYGHTGELWGIAGQTIAGAASLGGALLVWTGIALSLRRWRSWLKRPAASAVEETRTLA